MENTTVNLVGAGRVGQTLIGLLRSMPNYTVQDVVSARLASAQNAVAAAGTGHAVESVADMRPAHLWILAIPDTEIKSVAQMLSEAFAGKGTVDPAPVAVHCSGFFAAEEMAPLRSLGWHLASAHPVLSFSEPAVAMTQFNGIYCGVEGDAAALEVVRPLYAAMGAHLFDIQSDRKSLYHAAAVISNNFTVVLQALAQEAWASAGVSDEVARRLNATLINATAENVIAQGPKAALTGPAARGDTSVVKQQGQDLAKWHPAAGAVYALLSVMAGNLKTNGTTRGG